METNATYTNGESSMERTPQAANGEESRSLSSAGIYRDKDDPETPTLHATPKSDKARSREISELVEKAPESRLKKRMKMGILMFVMLALTGALLGVSIAFVQLQSKYKKLEKTNKPQENGKSDLLSDSTRADAKAILTK